MHVEVQTYGFNDNEIRVMADEQGEPWFVAKDVAKVLGYRDLDQAIRKHCKAAESSPVDSTGQVRYLKIIPERDVYRLIMRSKLPEAEAFEEWVVGEVLPSIRKHGGYIKGQEEMTEDELMAKALQVAHSKVQELEQKRKEDAPKVEQYDKFMNSESLFSMKELANHLGVGRNKLTRHMREKGILEKSTKRIMPKEPYNSNGYFKVTYTPLPNGTFKPNAKLTPEGFEHFTRKFEGLEL